MTFIADEISFWFHIVLAGLRDKPCMKRKELNF